MFLDALGFLGNMSYSSSGGSVVSTGALCTLQYVSHPHRMLTSVIRGKGSPKQIFFWISKDYKGVVEFERISNEESSQNLFGIFKHSQLNGMKVWRLSLNYIYIFIIYINYVYKFIIYYIYYIYYIFIIIYIFIIYSDLHKTLICTLSSSLKSDVLHHVIQHSQHRSVLKIGAAVNDKQGIGRVSEDK